MVLKKNKHLKEKLSPYQTLRPSDISVSSPSKHAVEKLHRKGYKLLLCVCFWPRPPSYFMPQCSQKKVQTQVHVEKLKLKDPHWNGLSASKEDK